MDTFHQPLDGNIGSGLTLSSQGRGELRETARWGKFIAIVTFVFIGLMVLGSLLFAVAGSSMLGEYSSAAGMMFFLVYLVGAAIALMPALFLYRFSRQARTALATDDQQTLDSSLANLKSLFKFYGIIMLIVLVLYGLIFLSTILGGTAALFF